MDTTPEHVEQPMPVPNDQPSIQSLVRADLELREQVGIARYGTSLQPFNGRDAVRDAYEEAMDLTLYLRQVMEERDQRHLPQHGSDVEEWIRRARNRHEAESPEWNALADLLDDYEHRTGAGTPLDVRIFGEHGQVGI